MADLKISALPASTTPLAGTEVLPIVQSSTTRQVSVANLTAGRAVSALSITATQSAADTSAIAVIASAATRTKVFGATGSTTAGMYGLLTNTGGSMLFGVENSGGGNVVTGSGSYSAYFGTNTNTPVSIAVNSAQVAVFDTSGNLGLGVTPSAWQSTFRALQVGSGTVLYNNSSSNGTFLGSNFYWNGSNNIYIASTTASAYGQVSGQHQWYVAPSGTAGNAITFTQAMTLDNSGNLQIGATSTPFPKLYVSDGTVGIGLGPYSTGSVAYAGTWTNHALAFVTNGAERGRFDTSGNLLVGTTTTTPSLGVGARILATGYISSTLSGSTNATDTLDVYSTGASAYRFYVDMAGTVHATSIVITAISDQRLKENIRDLDLGLSTIMALKPRRFDWKEGKGQDKKNAVGFIAQEFQEVLPNSISTFKAGEDGIDYLTMNHEELIPTLVKAIQEQQAIIEQLKAKVGL